MESEGDRGVLSDRCSVPERTLGNFSEDDSILLSYLIDIDGDVDDDVYEVSERQAGDERVGAVPHALVLVNYPQKGGIAHYAHHKHHAGDHCVDVLEMCFDGYGGGPVARRHFLYLQRAVLRLWRADGAWV